MKFDNQKFESNLDVIRSTQNLLDPRMATFIPSNFRSRREQTLSIPNLKLQFDNQSFPAKKSLK